MGFSGKGWHDGGNERDFRGTRCTTGEQAGTAGERAGNPGECPGIPVEKAGTTAENSGILREHAGSRGRVPSLRRGFEDDRVRHENAGGRDNSFP